MDITLADAVEALTKAGPNGMIFPGMLSLKRDETQVK